jgi:hypothetical protein
VKARIWKSRGGVWCFYVCGPQYDCSSFRPTWEEARDAALAEMGRQRGGGDVEPP